MRDLIFHVICAVLVSLGVMVNRMYGGSILYDIALAFLGATVSAYREYVNSVCRREGKLTGVMVGVGAFVLFLVVCLAAADLMLQGS